MKKSCETCAWYCHSDGNCYGSRVILAGKEFGMTLKSKEACDSYSFDGLEDWERDNRQPLQ